MNISKKIGRGACADEYGAFLPGEESAGKEAKKHEPLLGFQPYLRSYLIDLFLKYCIISTKMNVFKRSNQ